MNFAHGPVRTTIKIRNDGYIASVPAPQAERILPDTDEPPPARRRARFLPKIALFAVAAMAGAVLAVAVFEGAVPSVKVTYARKSEAIAR